MSKLQSKIQNNLLVGCFYQKSASSDCIRANSISNNKQSGIVLVVALVALVIMMLASVALIRSSNNNLLIAGNMAFKRDLINQAERVIPQVKAKLASGGTLGNDSTRYNNVTGENYYATVQASNASGIPDVLFNVSDTNGNNITDAASGVIVRYVIDRMCLATGEADETKCTMGGSSSDGPGCSAPCKKPGGINYPVYRITLRATGPRNTEAYLQTTYSN
jgi:Tfp pilus assembly protein PilX